MIGNPKIMLCNTTFYMIKIRVFRFQQRHFWFEPNAFNRNELDKEYHRNSTNKF